MDNNWGIVARVSTDEQFEEGVSFETQIELALELVKTNKGEVFDKYLEDGISAYKKRIAQRPEVIRLLNDVVAGKVKHIIAFKRDRLIRDPQDYHDFRKVTDAFGVKVYFTCPGETPWEQEDGNTAQYIMNNLQPILSRVECMQTAQRVRASVLSQVKKGIWRCGRPPYGYIYNKNTKRVEQVPDEVKVCHMIREMYLKGLGAGKIANILNNELRIPYRSPAYWKKETTKKKPRDYWYEGVVTAVITKPVYMGIQEWGGQWYDCQAIDPIFTKGEWEEAYQLYLSKLNRKIPHKYLNTMFLFKDVLYCTHCGEKMLPSYKVTRYIKQDGSESRYEYYCYYCTGRFDKQNGCKQKKLNREAVESALIKIISDDLRGWDIDRLYKKALDKIHKQLSEHQVKISQMEKEANNIDKKLREVTDSFIKTNNQIILKRLEQQAEELEAKKQELLLNLKELKNKDANPSINGSDVIKVFEKMQTWQGVMENQYINKEEKRKLILEVVDWVKVTKEGGVTIQYKTKQTFPSSINDESQQACI